MNGYYKRRDLLGQRYKALEDASGDNVGVGEIGGLGPTKYEANAARLIGGEQRVQFTSEGA